MTKLTVGKTVVHLVAVLLIIAGIALWSSSSTGPGLFFAGLIVEGVGFIIFDRALRRSSATREDDK
jgi:multisubunit Na+/H+ antiporter MnhB subunit